MLKGLIRFVLETAKTLTRFCIEHFGNIFQVAVLIVVWSLLASQVGAVYATVYLVGGLIAFMIGVIVYFIVGIFSALFITNLLIFVYQSVRAWAYEQEPPIWRSVFT